MRCSKYLCILNCWVQDEGTEVFGVKAGCWPLGEWLHIMREREGEEPCKTLLLSAEVATDSPRPSRTRYLGADLSFTQRGSSWGRAAKNKDYEGISMLVFSFSWSSFIIYTTIKNDWSNYNHLLLTGYLTQRSSQLLPLPSCQEEKVGEHPLKHKKNFRN